MNYSRFQALLWMGLLFSCTQLFAQSVADPDFRYTALHPRYDEGKGPVILYDEGHNNPFTLKGQYAAFAQVLEADGYRLATQRETLTRDALAEAGVFVTVNAIYDLMDWDSPPENAYTDEEVELLFDWVYQHGGSLFLITDNMPSSGSVSNLAARFGFNLINGFAQRKDGQPEIFSRTRGNLTANPITDVEGFAIDSIRCWGGTGFFPPSNAIVISSLGKDYDVFLPSRTSEMNYPVAASTPKITGVGLANGAILQCGRGRVCLFADGSPFAALLRGIKSSKQGMNHPDATQNTQFLLNIIHWLDAQH